MQELYVMTSELVLVNIILHNVLLPLVAFSLCFVVQAPQLVRSSISPTGLVDPSETHWSMEFDTQVSFVVMID